MIIIYNLLQNIVNKILTWNDSIINIKYTYYNIECVFIMELIKYSITLPYIKIFIKYQINLLYFAYHVLDICVGVFANCNI